jgi:hypothetical protein
MNGINFTQGLTDGTVLAVFESSLGHLVYVWDHFTPSGSDDYDDSGGVRNINIVAGGPITPMSAKAALQRYFILPVSVTF